EAKAVDLAARSGMPPPFPNRSVDDPDQYLVMNEPVQYAWVELGKNQRAEMGLSSTHPGAGRHGDLSSVFATARERNRTIPYGKNLYWSRATRNEKLKE